MGYPLPLPMQTSYVHAPSDCLRVLHLFCREFAKEKERVENKAGYMQLKEREKLDREMNG